LENKNLEAVFTSTLRRIGVFFKEGVVFNFNFNFIKPKWNKYF